MVIAEPVQVLTMFVETVIPELLVPPVTQEGRGHSRVKPVLSDVASTLALVTK